MLDRTLRAALAPALDSTARGLARAGLRPLWVTGLGFAAGMGACVAAALAAWPAALGLWLANRLLDGLDGPIARVTRPTEGGGFLDIVADFTIYSGFVLGVAVAVPDARLACVALLFAYYVSGTAFLAFSSLAERLRAGEGHGGPVGDERSLVFPAGLAEGFETIVVYVLFCLLPGFAETIAWSFAAAVAVTAAQRVHWALRLLN